MEGLGFPLVPLAVDDTVPFEISDTRPARKAKPGETWNAETKTGADGTVGIDPALGQIAASCPPIVVGDVIVVGSSHIHGYYPTRLRNLPGLDPRLRHQDRQAAVEVQPHSGAGRVRRRHVEERHQDRHAWRRQERRVGDLLGGSGSRPRLHSGRHAAQRRVRRPSSRRQPLRQQPRRARREDRQAASGTSRWSITISGTTTRRWRRT